MKNRYTYLITLGHLANDTAQGALPALLPLFIVTYNLNYQQAAGLMFANTILSSIMQPIFGYFSDKISKPWFISLGTALSGSSIAAMGFADSYWTLFGLSMLAGVGSAIFHPEAARLVNRISGKHKGKAMGTFSVGGNGGFALGPILAGLCAYTLGPHGLLIFAIFSITTAAILFHNMPKILSLVALSAMEEAKAHVNEHLTNDWRSFSKLSVIIFARSIVFSVMNTFIPIYWITVLLQSPASGSMALTILFSFGVVITFIGGIMADRLGLLKVIRFSLCCMVPVTILFPMSTNVWLSTALLLPLGFSIFALYSPIVVLGQTYLAKSVGFASGVTLGLGITLGGIIAPAIGWVADHYGLQTGLQLLTIIAVAALVFSFIIPEPKRKC